MYFQWSHKSTYSEQCNGEKAIEKGVIPVVGFKGIDEFEELKASFVDLTDKFNKLSVKLNTKSYLYNAIHTLIYTAAKNDNTAMILETICLDLNQDLEVDNEISTSEDNDTESSECEITEDNAAKTNVAEASESEPSDCETTEDNPTEANIIGSKVTDSNKSKVTKPS